MRLLLLDTAIGLLLLGAIALAARPRHRRGSARMRRLGSVLVALPMPAAVAVHLTLQLPTRVDQGLFIGGAALFAVGAALVLGGEDDDWREERDDESPPWWPAFERDLRDYESERARRERLLL